MIRSFACKKAKQVLDGKYVRGWPTEVQRKALTKLRLIDAAQNINDLRQPPGNRLEKLSGDRKGQHSIRINDQWRICFVWHEGAHDVEIVDYH